MQNKKKEEHIIRQDPALLAKGPIDKPLKEEPLFENPTPEAPPEAQTIKDPEDIRLIETKIKLVTESRDQIRSQLMGLENQLFVLNELINPETPTNGEAQKQNKGPQTPDNTI